MERRGKAATVNVLRGRTTAAFAASANTKVTIMWCFFEVTFGKFRDTDEPVRRSGLDRVRICVYHIGNEDTKRRPDVVRGHLAAMIIDVCQLPVDVIAGDTNEAAYSCHRRQENASLQDSSINDLFQQLIAGYVEQLIFGPGDPTQPNGGRLRGYHPPETWFLARLPHAHFISNN